MDSTSPNVTPAPVGLVANPGPPLDPGLPEGWRTPDIVLAGGGLSGLTLAVELARQPFFKNQRILLLDRDEKEKNDRTWCFWATEEEPLPPVSFRSWNSCKFFGEQLDTTLQIDPYRYHMVRGLDFYRWAREQLENCNHVLRLTTNILEMDATTGLVRTEHGDFTAGIIFNSAFTRQTLVPESSVLYPNPPFTSPAILKSDSDPYVHLLQHFQGWIVETPVPAFDPTTMTFMDYRLEQKGQTRFVYVLPFSETRALVEFTVFSPALCRPEEYDAILLDYLHNKLNISKFTIEEQEFGVIPMTDRPFSPGEGRVINIGTAGGFVKASSGYAFLRTQRRLRAFVRAWAATGRPNLRLLRSAWYYRFFDSILLRVLQDNRMTGKDFFTRLFRRLPAPLVFRFLDEDAGFWEILRLVSAPPTWPFLRAALRQIPVFFSHRKRNSD